MNSAPYIFISYSRKDADIAASLHNKLEKYIYPKQWVQEEFLPPHPTHIRPVFLDTENLSTKGHNFTEELREQMRNSHYLMVICTENAARSAYVREGIAYFLETHGNNTDLILPVYVNNADVNGLPECINNIKAVRNCPVYSRDKDAIGKLKRQYCFYRIIEFILKVDFEKLYNRHEEYKKRKRRMRTMITTIVAAVICSSLGYGWHNANKRAISERERAKTAFALANFERKIFPYSLVVGYVDNFLQPMMKALHNRQTEEGATPNHVIIAMPYSFEELQHKTRKKNSLDTFEEYNDYEGIAGETIPVEAIQRKNVGITRINFREGHVNLYFDEANTVSAFENVIRYKFRDDNPLKPTETQENKDRMVREYTDEFIQCTLEKLGPEYSQYVHFVRTKQEIRDVLNKLRS